MAEKHLATVPQASSLALSFDPEQVELIKNRYFVEGASDKELELFLTVAQHRGLDPTKKHIYAVQRWTRDKGNVIAYQVSIDGLRLIAERTGKYQGQVGPYWCGKDGQWRDVWLEDRPPAAAKVGVYKAGFKEPTWGVARWDTYVQTKKDGAPTQFWQKMPDLMIAKVAESLALRKAFPEDTGGLYTTEEMGQAENTIDVESRPVDRTTGEVIGGDRTTDTLPIDVTSRRSTPESTQEGRSATNPVEPPADTSEDVPDYTGDPDDWDASNRYLRKVADAHAPKLSHELTKAWLIAASIKAGNPKTSTKDMSPMALRFLAGRIKENREKVRSAADEALSNPDIYALCYPDQSPVEDVFPPKPEVEVIDAEPIEDTEPAPF